MQTIVNLGTGGADLNGQNGSTSGADSNDALFLDWPGDNAGDYLYCAGGSTNYPSVPDEAALDITGAIDLRIHVAMDDYSPVGDHVLFAKGTTNASTNYRLTLRTSSILQFRVGDGASSYTADSSVAVNTIVDDSADVWLRLTYDPTTGSVEFFYGLDGAAWTQLGTTQTIAVITPTTNNATCEIMGRGTLAQAGKLYRAQVLDGIGGTTVLDVDCSQIASGSDTSFTALTGQTVTINRSTSGRKSVAVVSPVWLFGTDDYMEVASSPLLDFDVTDDFTLLAVVRTWDTPRNYGAYVSRQDTVTAASYRITTSATNLIHRAWLDDGTSNTTAFRNFTAGDAYTVVQLVNRATDTMYLINDDDTASVSIASIGSTSSLTAPLVIGARKAGAISPQDFELLSVAVFRRALTDAEVTQLTSYYESRWS